MTNWRRFIPSSYRPFIAAAHDGAMAAASFVLALYLRLGEDQFHLSLPYLVSGTVIFTALSLPIFIGMRLYRGLWRYASLPDLIAIVRAVTVAVAAFVLLMFTLTRLEGIPRSTPLIQWMLLLLLLGGPRFFYRALKDRTFAFDFRHDASRLVPLLLIGTGGSAELFIRECSRRRDAPYRVVGLVDDNPARKGRSLHGITIFGGTEAIPAIVARLGRKGIKPQRLILAEDDPEGKKTARLLEISESLGLALGRLPALSEFKNGAPGKAEIRAVAIEDLLGRAQNVHDREAMRALIEGRRVLVTGAGGSIGSELCRQIARLAPAQIILLEQGEFALYGIDLELATQYPGIPCHALLADVRDAGAVEAAFRRHRPEIVFHAAAVKHVPLAEANPLPTLATNVLGTRHVADAARAHGALAMVLISTDKAVNPANIMGASKRLAESYCQALGALGQGGGTRFLTVRFGNVLGSTGSVVPLFRSQLERGGPLTVTHPDMVRYFMTIREAVELVIQAAAMGSAMEGRKEAIFVLDMGKPVKISDLAAQMIRLAGLKPGRDVNIVYTGLRPGEKLFEELFYDAEKVKRTEHKGILLASARETEPESLKKSLVELEKHCKEGDESGAVALLARLVPEYATPAPPDNERLKNEPRYA